MFDNNLGEGDYVKSFEVVVEISVEEFGVCVSNVECFIYEWVSMDVVN